MAKYITKLEAKGIYNRFDISQNFKAGINIIHGLNGSGKTTVLHLLANILNGDYYRLLDIPFSWIRLWYSDGNFITARNNKYYVDNHEDSISICINHDRRGVKISRKLTDFDGEQIIDMQESYSRLLNDYLQNKVILSSAYFPAFRTMIEAWDSLKPEEISEKTGSSNKSVNEITYLARKLFGNFIPRLNYPTPSAIEERISRQITEIAEKILILDRELMSQIYLDILSNLEKNPSQNKVSQLKLTIENIDIIFNKIKTYPVAIENLSVTKIYNKLNQIINFPGINSNISHFTDILNVYLEALNKILQILEQSFTGIMKYLSSVNEFLEGKHLTIYRTNNTVNPYGIQVNFNDGSIANDLAALSSGERQILTMIYAATYMSKENVVLIDEPEISLHIDWQRLLLIKMSEQLGQRQVIVCTHSPFIAEEHDEDCLIELKFNTTDKHLWGKEDQVKENIKFQDDENIEDI